MRQCVLFQTPGLIPLEAFTAFGVNAKPASTNPFGYFGTGLKYAIAVLLREGQEVVLWRGKDKYTFYVKREEFRDKEFDYVRMKKQSFSIRERILGHAQYTKLPFTTELGKNWKLWQAFRELETNTRDESGRTELYETVPDDPYFTASGDYSAFMVFGSKFVDEWHDRLRNFLPDGEVMREDAGIQVIDRPSKHVYYRSVRIMDLKEESEFTYNFLRHVDLTEDRTAMHPFILEMEIAQHIANSEDDSFVRRVMTTPRYERRLSFSYVSAPSRTWVGHAESSPNVTARDVAEKVLQAIAPTSKIIITVPKSEITDDEREKVRYAMEEIFGEVEIQDMREAA